VASLVVVSFLVHLKKERICGTLYGVVTMEKVIINKSDRIDLKPLSKIFELFVC
jgi:hypothetical protein